MSNNPAQQQQLSAAIFGQAPIERVVKLIADFIYPHLFQQNVEIEAKFGVILDKQTDQRIQLPIENEVVLSTSGGGKDWFRFKSDMTKNQHRHFNELLNTRVQESVDNPLLSRVSYVHLREIDEFYQFGTSRIRLTRDEATKQTRRIIEKIRIDDLHIHIPYAPFDCRISVNLENPVGAQLGPQQRPSGRRRKDRLTYRHELWQIDLTQVTALPSEDGKQLSNSEIMSHELELEVANVQALRAEAERASQSLPNNYIKLVQVFANNIKVLASRAPST